jgi:uncharacterized protein (DUF1684 family)
MTGVLVAVLVALVLQSPQWGAPSGPIRLEPDLAAELRNEILKARAESEAWLRGAPTSYLATVARRDFAERTTLTVGRAEDNDVRLDAPTIQPHHLRVTVVGDRFRVEAIDPAARVSIKDEETREATVEPSYIKVDRFLLRLSHQHFPAIIVFDPQSPRFRDYKGLAFFPVDLNYRFELPLESDPSPKAVVIMSTLGNQRRASRVGWFEFVVDGTRCRLEATRLLEPGVGEDSIMILFRDATSGSESYPLGRYVDVKRLANGRYLLDFNTAYNPACAFSDHYNCPIPPKGNTLNVAIRAGEKDSHYH